MPYKKKETPKTVEKWRSAVITVNREREKQGLPKLSEELFRLNPPLTPEQEAKIPPVYLDMITFSKKIVNEQWAIEIAKELVTWVHTTPDAIKINEFLVSKGIPKFDFYHLIERYKVLADANRYVLEVLGNHRERNTLSGAWQSAPGLFMMGFYDSDWQREMLRRDDVKLKQNQTTIEDLTKIVGMVFKPVPHTEEVARSLVEKGSNTIHESERNTDTDTSVT